MPIALRTRVPSALLLLSLSAAAQQKPAPLSPFVKQDAPLLILEHVRLIDGTGAAPREDMRIDIAGGKNHRHRRGEIARRLSAQRQGHESDREDGDPRAGRHARASLLSIRPRGLKGAPTSMARR